MNTLWTRRTILAVLACGLVVAGASLVRADVQTATHAARAIPLDAQQMDGFQSFLAWAWERHHNPLSWYIRPLFLLPYCYFAYKRSGWGMALTLTALATSMFWFPRPAEVSPQVTEFLEIERQYLTGPWPPLKVLITGLAPLMLVLLGWGFWRRSWVVGAWVINLGAISKVAWSFYFGSETAWSLVPPAATGLLICNLVLFYAYRRIHNGSTRSGTRSSSRSDTQPAPTADLLP